MVVLFIGLDARVDARFGIDTVSVLTSAEALAMLRRRAFDAAVVGPHIPDTTVDAMVAVVAREHRTVPLVVVADTVSDAVAAVAWERVASSSRAALEAAVARAAEVGRLRREVERMSNAPATGGRRDVLDTFERGSIRDMERLMIMDRLRRLGENRTRSAVTLDISVRTLRNKLRDYRGMAAAEVPASTQG